MTRTLNYDGLLPRVEAEKAVRRIVALTNYRRNVPVALEDFPDAAERHGFELMKRWGWAKPSGRGRAGIISSRSSG